MGRTKKEGESLNHHFSHIHSLESVSFTQSQQPNIQTQCCQNHRNYDTLLACEPCNFFIHRTCAKLQSELNHPSHPSHTLTILTGSTYTNASFSCDACHKPSTGFTYNCSICSFDLDTHCATIAEVTKNGYHLHPLTLTYRCPYPQGYFICDICHEKGINVWLYRCSACRFDVHLDCIRANSAPPPFNQTGPPPIVPTAVAPQRTPPGMIQRGQLPTPPQPRPAPHPGLRPVYPAQPIQPPYAQVRPSPGLFGQDQVGKSLNSIAGMFSTKLGPYPQQVGRGRYAPAPVNTKPYACPALAPRPYGRNQPNAAAYVPAQVGPTSFGPDRASSFGPPAYQAFQSPNMRPPTRRSYSSPTPWARPARPYGPNQPNMMLGAMAGSGGGAWQGGQNDQGNGGYNGNYDQAHASNGDYDAQGGEGYDSNLVGQGFSWDQSQEGDFGNDGGNEYGYEEDQSQEGYGPNEGDVGYDYSQADYYQDEGINVQNFCEVEEDYGSNGSNGFADSGFDFDS